MNEPDDEVRDAISPELRESIPIALYAVNAELGLPDQIGLKALGRKIGEFLAITAIGTMEDRALFIQAATTHLSHLPAMLVLKAVDDACKELSWPRELVKWVTERVCAQAARIDGERTKLLRLEELSL